MAPDTVPAMPADFAIRRGTNISHWLSQSEERSEERRRRFTQADVVRLAAMGLDHLRLPVDEEQMWDEDGAQVAEAWDLLHQGIGWCLAAGLRVIVDLHILRCHHFNEGAEGKGLFRDPAMERRFGQCWVELSQHLARYPVDRLAYEIMNEPVADDPEDWNRVLRVPCAAIREREPGRIIAVGSNRWCQAKTFPDLKVPGGDARMVLVLHYYNPMLITHHQANWWHGAAKDYCGPVQYPGSPVAPEHLQGLDPRVRAAVEAQNEPYDAAAMARDIRPAVDQARKLGLPLWCNEFGVYATVADDVRRRWYRDFLAVLARHGIPWCNWDFRGSFGIFDRQTNAETAVAEALLGREER